MFRRRQQDATAPDPDFPALDPARAADFRRLVTDGLRSRGIHIERLTRVVLLDAADVPAGYSGVSLGFDNLALAVRDCGSPEEMTALVERHLDNVLDLSSPADDSPEEFRRSLRARLVPTYTLGSSEDARFSRPWARDTALTLVLDSPTTIAIVGEATLRSHGSLDELLAIGTGNTRAELESSQVEVFDTGAPGPTVRSVTGDSFYVSSAPLALPELLRRWDPSADLSRGVIFGIPHRHRLLYSVVTGPESVIAGFETIAVLAAAGYESEPGHTSPHTYLWRDGEVTAVAGPAPEGLRVVPGEYLEGVLSGTR